MMSHPHAVSAWLAASLTELLGNIRATIPTIGGLGTLAASGGFAAIPALRGRLAQERLGYGLGYAPSAGAAVHSTSDAGRRTVIAVPCSGALCTSMLPSRPMTMAWQIDRPRPVP